MSALRDIADALKRIADGLEAQRKPRFKTIKLRVVSSELRDDRVEVWLGGAEYVVAKNLSPIDKQPGLFWEDSTKGRVRNARDGIERWHEVWIRRSVAPRNGPGIYIVKCVPQPDIDTWEFHDWERIEP